VGFVSSFRAKPSSDFSRRVSGESTGFIGFKRGWNEFHRQKRGDLRGYSGHKHQTGSKRIGITDAKGNLLHFSKLYAVNKHDSPLFKPALEALMNQFTRLDIPIPTNTVVNLDTGFDSNENKKACLQKGCTPNELVAK
jgi:hypothetical protein